jgi:polar amino acid transport system permease protein
MSEKANIRIEISDGASIPDPKDKRLITAWSVAFVGANALLLYLCLSKPDPYWLVLRYVSDGLLVTFQVTIGALFCALPIGLVTGIARLSRFRPINLAASTYVEIIRGIPLIVQIMYLYYGMSKYLKIEGIPAAIAAISFCYGAYMGEVFRAGIDSVDHGQTEAARSLGFNRFQTLMYIILPQSMRTILPPIGNESIAMLKDTSLVSIVAVADILRLGRQYASKHFNYFETYSLVAILYLIITLILSKGVSMMEARLSYYDRK